MTDRGRRESRREGLVRPGALLLAAAVLAACGGDPGDGDDRSPRRITVPTGTVLSLTLERELGTRSSREGDRFTARVSEAVTVAGREAIPVGSAVHGRVLGVEERAGGARALRLGFQTIRVRGGSPILSARLVEARPEVRSGDGAGEAAATVGGGAAAGAGIGSVVDGGDGAAVGAAVGAAAGSGVVLATGDRHAVLPEGSAMRIELAEPLRVRIP